MFGLNTELSVLLMICLVAACAFEFINGFHDTANAVATVIYTKSLKPTYAVIWSGIWNFIGVYVGGIAVAMGIVNLLPTEALVDQNSYHAIAMILALIITAILWNLGTWYLGIPCSSSHTLIGSIFGVGIAYMFLPGVTDIALNWAKVKDIGLSLLISPVIGFGLTLGLMQILKKYLKKKQSVLFEEQPKKKTPPIWIRSILILTCTSVSFSHGSNDGQKGVGLMMIILIGLIPAQFAINTKESPEKLLTGIYKIEYLVKKIDAETLPAEDRIKCELVKEQLINTKQLLNGTAKFDTTTGKKSFAIRKNIILISKETKAFIGNNEGKAFFTLNKQDTQILKSEIAHLKTYTEYSPWWVILMISISLGLGTMIGWKRIVVTVGEKIGKTPLTYAQGASAELVTATTITLASSFGLPVSTTHVLSSGVAGSMVAQKGLKNLRAKTVRSILIAWLVTLPVTIILAGGIFLLLRFLLG
jgi:phosphate/sulfate permease